jgi:hypothetical protein
LHTETWTTDANTPEERTWHVLKIGFGETAAEILDAVKQLPDRASVYETLTYQDNAELVFVS